MKYKLNSSVALSLAIVLTGCNTDSTNEKETAQNGGQQAGMSSYVVIDTEQKSNYHADGSIISPAPGEEYYGQDAEYTGTFSDYSDNGDGTVTDNNTGLIWQQSPDTNGDGTINAEDRLSYDEAVARLETFELAGYSDWRMPSVKELYSLMNFNGNDPSGVALNDAGCPSPNGQVPEGEKPPEGEMPPEGCEPKTAGTGEEVADLNNSDLSNISPFIDSHYFDFAYGDTAAGERNIDVQYASSNLYVSNTTDDGGRTLFGVNFADGRIKGYDLTLHDQDKMFTVIYVRGNEKYGDNEYLDNNDGTITDKSTQLMWSKSDNGSGLDWGQALAWVEEQNEQNYLGYNDWRMPNAKELHSLVDYTRSPDTTGSPAIDPVFSSTEITNEADQSDYPAIWTNTTHLTAEEKPGGAAVYINFGRAMGYMNGAWGDVHGAGAQRSDPKVGNPEDYPEGNGPQGDAIRIDNFVRLVRDAN